MKNFTVTLNYKCHYGFVEYNPETKKVSVNLSVAEAKAKVEQFLHTPMIIDVPQGETIRDFVTTRLEPLASLDNFKVAMTRLWGKTDVRVEWSMPPGLAEKLAPSV